MFRYKNKQYKAKELCEILSEVKAETLSYFENESYEGFSAITENQYGSGSPKLFNKS